MLVFFKVNIHAQQLYPANFDVATLNGTNGFRIPGIDPSSQFGAEAKFIGDINNDGFEDLALGVNNADIGTVDLAGAVYVIFGSNTGFPASFDITTLNGTNGFVIEGRDDESRRMGNSVEGIGDVNGDGIDDLAISASRVDFVIYGRSTAFAPTLNIDYIIGGGNGFRMNFSFFSSNEIIKLGDVNGDNIDDFVASNVIGGPAAIVFGRSSNFPELIDTAYLDGTNGFRTSSFPSSRAAYLVGGAGDINNDGFDDIIIGEWSRSGTLSSGGQRTRVLFGKPSFSIVEDLVALDGTNGFTVDNSGGGFLVFVGSLGDVNSDGVDDFYSERSAIFGKQSSDPFPAHIPLSDIEDNSLGFRMPGFLTSSSIGDINQDGINDFISVYRRESGSDANAYIVFGSTSGFPNPIEESTLNGTNGFVIPGFRTSNIGRPVSGGGDINGDGIADFIVGSPGETPIGSTERTGEAYVIFGGDHFAEPLNMGYPQAINETTVGFTLVVNGPETGTIHYAIYPGNFSGDPDHDDILNGTGATENDSFLMNTANTDISEIISSLAAGTTYDVYLFLEDGVGNQGEIYHIDNVTTLSTSDTEDPTASNPSPISVQCSGDVPSPDPLVVTDEADNSGVPPVVAFVSDVSDGNSNPEVITRTYSVTDGAGNSINVTQTITVNDTTNPTASNPAPINVTCVSDIPIADSTVVIDEADNCGGIPVVAFVSDVNTSPGIITRTYSVTDAARNSINVTQTITVNDTTDPTASNPASINVTCVSDIPIADSTVVTDEADNCGGIPVVAFVSDVNTSPGIITRTYSVTDAAGNSINVTQTITVNDTTNPTASNPSPINVACTSDIPIADINVVTDEADNCGGTPMVAFVSDLSDGNTNPEIIIRTYSVTDVAGNSINVTQTITVNDTTNPTASNPVPINVACTSDIPVPDINVVTDEADNCRGIPIVAFVSDASDGNINPEVITRTYSVTDGAGNSINVTQTITVNDTTNPVIDCPANVTQNVDPGLDTAVITYVNITGSDNCSVRSVQQVAGLPSGAEFPIGTTTNIFEVIDDAGNSSRCSFDVIIVDTSPTVCEVNAGEDEEIAEGDDVQLAAIASTQGNFTWFPSSGLNNTSIANPVANPSETTTYTVVFTGDDGCIAEDIITVFVRPLEEDETKYGFSPDGDGINEFWEIDTIENYPNNKVSIFNRWGDLVFEVEGYNNTSRVFRGIANRKRGLGGDRLPEGTYFFSIEIEGSHNLKKSNGFLVIKR
ncbi:gliding motility-associated C-terminal domain-containing protein [Aquimarina sp. D1M17]|uniref:HYR-like domain-containing protein n=1 Tax=Aquimarina acroporae TaxID=2937283 RepID=UPI0020C0B982|nr:gliding motility-associated C-terminal domain-containing protein [Aquimarina acroporae]MCK8523864.1 gliding motility-associated C-terminal domain-containing protein [Aquimarina acroporae]